MVGIPFHAYLPMDRAGRADIDHLIADFQEHSSSLPI